MSDTPSERELAFATRTKAVLNALGEADANAKLDTTFKQLAHPATTVRPARHSRARSFGWPALVAALLVGAVLAALVAWLQLRQAPAQVPMAFDGQLESAAPTVGPAVSRDAQGRVTAIATLVDGQPDGERVLFRAGRIVRIEHWRAGRLHGVATDFDGAGRATHLETWHEGKLQGPTLDLDPELRPRARGTAP